MQPKVGDWTKLMPYDSSRACSFHHLDYLSLRFVLYVLSLSIVSEPSLEYLNFQEMLPVLYRNL